MRFQPSVIETSRPRQVGSEARELLHRGGSPTKHCRSVTVACTFATKQDKHAHDHRAVIIVRNLPFLWSRTEEKGRVIKMLLPALVRVYKGQSGRIINPPVARPAARVITQTPTELIGGHRP